jgi:hypothetical protein
MFEDPIPSALVSTLVSKGGLVFFPQTCPASMLRLGQDTQALGSCVMAGVSARVLACLARSRTLQPLRRQVPFFKAFTGAVVTLDVRKTATRVVADSVVTVVAFNIAGLSGIGGLWAENGLRTNPSVQCGPAAACAFPGVCDTIWLEVQNCSFFDSFFGVSVLGLELTEESASVRFDTTVAGLAEGTYPFTMHFPVNNNRTWTYVPVDGSYTLTAVAAATQSKAWLCQNATCPPAQFISANGGTPPVVVEIDAKDVDGFAIQRDGEALTVTVQLPDGTELSVQAVFDTPSKTYQAAIPGLMQAGVHRVLLMTSLATTRLEVANLTLDCAAGYAADPDRQLQCVPERKACAANEYQDADGACKGHPTMGIAAVSRELRLNMKKACGRHQKASLDPLEVRLVSGDIDDASIIRWNASSSASWISLELTDGIVSSLKVAAELPFTVDLHGLNDTAHSGPLTANITIQSKSSNGDVRFLNGSETLRILVKLEIEAKACASTSVVALRAVAAAQDIFNGSDVVAGDSVRVSVQSFDSDGLPVERPTQQIRISYRAAELIQNASDIVMKWTGKQSKQGYENEYVGDIAGGVLAEGQYTLLLVDGDKTEARMVFTVAKTRTLELVFGVSAMVLLGGMLAVFLILVYSNQSRAKAVAISFLKLELKSGVDLLLDSWDAAGTASTLVTPACLHRIPLGGLLRYGAPA